MNYKDIMYYIWYYYSHKTAAQEQTEPSGSPKLNRMHCHREAVLILRFASLKEKSSSDIKKNRFT